jgi:hypothetical protein
MNNASEFAVFGTPSPALKPTLKESEHQRKLPLRMEQLNHKGVPRTNKFKQ